MRMDVDQAGYDNAFGRIDNGCLFRDIFQAEAERITELEILKKDEKQIVFSRNQFLLLQGLAQQHQPLQLNNVRNS